MIARGGIDLGGTKIQTVVVDGRWKVLGEARRPTPTTGGPEDVAEQMAGAMREAATEASVEPGALAAVGVGSPGDVDERTGTVSQARNLPGWEGEFELGTVASGGARRPGSGGQRRAGRDRSGVPSRRGPSLQVAGGGLLGDRRRRRAGPRRQAVAGPRRRRRDRPHRGQEGRRAGVPAGDRGCLEAYAGRAAMEAKAPQRARGRAARPSCSRS